MNTSRDFKWACRTILELNNIAASPHYMAAFQNPDANERWIKAVIKGAQPQIGSMTSAQYNKAVDILQENGINVNPYTP